MSDAGSWEEGPLVRVTRAFRDGSAPAGGVAAEALARHHAHDPVLRAYREVDEPGVREAARRADERLEEAPGPPLCGVPVSVKDLYGVDGFTTYAGSPRSLPEPWNRDGWLVGRLRSQGAVFVGKTHTVEFGYGALGLNPHWGTPRNPWDPSAHRIPGGSSSGAGVSLLEGSALVALGSDTGGSVRIPASMTGVVGFRPTTGRWPTSGVVPLSETLDAVGLLASTVADVAYVFGAVDPRWGEPEVLLDRAASPSWTVALDPGPGAREEGRRAATGKHAEAARVGLPRCGVWSACQADIRRRIDAALAELAEAGWQSREVDGDPVDRAEEVYLDRQLAGAEARAFLERELPDWIPLLASIVGERIRGAPHRSSELYTQALRDRERLRQEAGGLFRDVDVLALPAATFTPPPAAELQDLASYAEANRAALRPTCSPSVLGLPAITIPAGLDDAGMPVGLQLVGTPGGDEGLLSVALAAERILGSGPDRLGPPPLSAPEDGMGASGSAADSAGGRRP